MKNCCPAGWLKFFKAIGDRHRQEMLTLIKKGRSNASEIIKKTKLSQPTVSHHLGILEEAGLISAEKRGKEVFYSINRRAMRTCCMGFLEKFSH